METEQKKEYLKEYEKAVRQMKRSEEKITEMRLSKIMPSVGNDGMPHAHNNTDLSAYAALLDEEESWYSTYARICNRIYCHQISFHKRISYISSHTVLKQFCISINLHGLIVFLILFVIV